MTFGNCYNLALFLCFYCTWALLLMNNRLPLQAIYAHLNDIN